MMAEELSLPRLAWDPITESFRNNRPQKRVRLSSPPMSSDPAIFSSDDDPSADNYTAERRKKKYRGPWYRQQPASDSGSQDSQDRDNSKKSKRTLERQFDSGVFMGSDGTDVDEGMEEFESDNGISSSKLPLRQSRTTQTARPPSAEELAQRQIADCLETGNENIDLSSRNLSTLSNITIRPLAAFTCVPPVTEGVFSRLEPRLKIFLASNNLRTLPGELFNLDRLTVLSIRGNRIRNLPPGVGNLRNLKQLNIAQNRLRCLPFEILDLFSDSSRLQSYQFHPNPFYEPLYPANNDCEATSGDVPIKVGLGGKTRSRRGAICCVSPDQRRRSWHPEWKVIYQARTEVRFLDINGKLLRGPALSSDPAVLSEAYDNAIPVADIDDIPEPPTPRGNNISRAPSLLEVALIACSRNPQLPYLSSYLSEHRPEYLPNLLEEALAKKESGGSKCTICKRSFIIPRTEWLEWWEISKVIEKRGMASAASPLRQMENERDAVEKIVPLIRRGCSWLCVPGNLTIE